MPKTKDHTLVEARAEFLVQERLPVLYSRPTLDSQALRGDTHSLLSPIPSTGESHFGKQIDQPWETKRNKLPCGAKRGRGEAETAESSSFKTKQNPATKHLFFSITKWH